jgi:putative flippase GtrA
MHYSLLASMFKRLLLDRQTQVRFIKFFAVGGTGYGVNVLSFNLVKAFFEPNIAFTIAFIISTSTHYCLNRFWALKSTRSDKWRQFIEYLGTVLLSYIISLGSFTLFKVYMTLGFAQALSIPPSTMVVFFILNFWVFKHQKH